MISRIWLQFLKKQGQEYSPHSIAISDVATHLVNREVRYAVFNACRSAYTDNECINLASALIEHGLDAVVAMSYNIASSAVETFVKAFYGNLFKGNSYFQESSGAARAVLAAHPMKRTKFNEKVAVADWIVPICLASESEDAPSFNADLLDEGVNFRHLDFLQDVDEYPIGRENDILLLENSLLLESNVGLLVGRAGSGKTKLLDYMASWWEATNFVRRTIWGDLDHMKAGIDVADLQSIFEDLIMPEDAMFGQSAIEYLRSNRLLIVFDGIESYICPEGSSLSQQQKALKAFLRELYGGQTLVLLSSRKPEPWLDRLGPRKSKQEPAPFIFTSPLEGLAVLPGVQVATFLLHERRGGVQFNAEDVVFIEQLVKLVEGNPLALELLTIDFCQKSLSIEDYYYSLIEGAEIKLDQRWLDSNERARSISELSDLIHKATMAGREKRQDMLIDSLIKGIARKPVSGRGFMDAMSPSFLGMMWRAVASDDLIYYVLFLMMASASYINTSNLHGLFSTLFEIPKSEDMVNFVLMLMMSPPEMRPSVEEVLFQDESIKYLKGLLEELVETLLNMGYLESPATNMRNLPQKPYFRINPLLTIMARTSLDYAESRELLLEASFMYQAFCLSSWPHDYMYWNKAWDQPKFEISLTFINFYAAVRVGLKRDAGHDFSSEVAIIMLIACISKGTFADPSRHDLLKPLWAVVTSRALKTLDLPFSNEPSSFATSIPTPLMPEDLPETERPSYCDAVLRMLCAGQLAMGGLGMVITGQLSQGNPLLDKILVSLEQNLAIKSFGPRLEDLHALSESWKIFLKLLSAAAFNNVGVKTMWEVRETFIREQIERRGVEEYPPEQKSWRDIPYKQNSMSVPFASLVDVPAKVRAMASTGHYNDARRLLQAKLDAEINQGGNQAQSRATIYELLYWVSKKEDKWLDAISHLNRAKALREFVGKVETVQRVAWEGKLARLYEKSGDLDTVIAYAKLLISRANAVHATDPGLEIACLRQVWKLEYSKRLDSIVSDIFLVVRAASTMHRTQCAYRRIPKGQWLLESLLITESSKSVCMFGATDPRPQTVAIAFLLMMFGNLINLNYIGRIYKFTQDPEQSPERVIEIGLELEQRLFSPTQGPLTYRHFSVQEAFEPQRHFFEHLYVCGERYLAGEFVATDRGGRLILPEAPFSPSTVWGNTATGGFFGSTVLTEGTYRCPTRIMLQLAGYMTDWPE